MLYVELKLLYLATFSSSFLEGQHYYLDMVKKNKINSTRPNKMKDILTQMLCHIVVFTE